MSDTRYINLRLDPELHEWVRARAAQRRKSMTSYVRDLLIDQMERDPVVKLKVKAAAKAQTKPQPREEVPLEEIPLEDRRTQRCEFFSDGHCEWFHVDGYGREVPGTRFRDGERRGSGTQPPPVADTQPQTPTPPDEHIPMPRHPVGRRLYNNLTRIQERVERELAPLDQERADKLLRNIRASLQMLREGPHQYEDVEASVAGYRAALKAGMAALTGEVVDDE